MSLTNCRFYEDKYPEVDSYVMVNVKQVRAHTFRLRVLSYSELTLLGDLARSPRWAHT